MHQEAQAFSISKAITASINSHQYVQIDGLLLKGSGTFLKRSLEKAMRNPRIDNDRLPGVRLLREKESPTGSTHIACR